jgi:hypothetical protein
MHSGITLPPISTAVSKGKKPASSTLEINQHNTEEELHPLQALSYLICSQAMSISTLDYGKNGKTVKLLLTFKFSQNHGKYIIVNKYMCLYYFFDRFCDICTDVHV